MAAMADEEPLPEWEREFLEKQAAERAAAPPECEHAWADRHKPGHLFYWVRQCMLCHEVDWDDLDTEIGKLTMGDRCPATTRHARRFSTKVCGLQCQFAKGHHGDHCAYTGPSENDIFWPQETMDTTPSGEDRIRGAMAEAQDHPGRIVSR